MVTKIRSLERGANPDSLRKIKEVMRFSKYGYHSADTGTASAKKIVVSTG